MPYLALVCTKRIGLLTNLISMWLSNTTFSHYIAQNSVSWVGPLENEACGTMLDAMPHTTFEGYALNLLHCTQTRKCTTR